MLPLKPPAPKKKLKDVKLIHFPICDQDGDVLNENEWPIFQGIFNGNVIIIKHPKDISRISNMVSKIDILIFGIQIFIIFFNIRVLLDNMDY